MKIHRRYLLPIAIAATGFLALTAPRVKAAAYASSVTNNAGTIQFYLNESGSTILVTYEDNSVNSTFDGVSSTATNLPSGFYSFSMGTHSSYAIAVTKFGLGSAGLASNVIQNTNLFSGVPGLFVAGNERGVAVNANPASPYFGRIYLARCVAGLLWDFNPDGSFVAGSQGAAGTNCGVAWATASSTTCGPYRMSVGPDDSLWVSDLSSAASTIWQMSPDLSRTNMVLGNPGWINGYNARVHSSEESRPLFLPNPVTGTNLLVIDGDFGDINAGSINNVNGQGNLETNANAILVYSNITYASFPLQTGPSLVGPSVSFTNLSGTYIAPIYAGFDTWGGYLYGSQYRSGVTKGDPALVQVYSLTNYTMAWSSRYNGGANDYFFTAAAGGSSGAPIDVAVSPDGKYLATIGIDNHLTICSMTNGIPDVSTIKTVVPTSFAANGRGLCWDAADNIYTISSGTAQLQEWTLGLSTTITTAGNLSGATNFSSTPLIPNVSVYATNNSVISQNNTHGNPTTGYFTIVRSGGNTGAPLTVTIGYSGTATNGTYTAGSAAGSVVFAAGQTVTNISITPVTDNQPRPTTYLMATVSPIDGTYTIVASTATISIMNTAMPFMIGATGATSMYNAFSNDYVSMTITRWGDTNTTETVNTFTTAGTATAGTDYTTPAPVTFNPGDLTQIVYLHPLNGGQVPNHNPNLTYSGNKTITLGIANGSGYNGAPATSSFTVVDSAYPPATVLFTDPLTNSDDATNWLVAAANGNLDNVNPVVDPEFGCNLYNTPLYPVPTPPNGATNALKVTVNKPIDSLGDYQADPMTAVNLYLTNNAFTGNYAVRFNMNILQGNSTTLEFDITEDEGIYDAEEGPMFGVNMSGTQTNWFAVDGFALGDSQKTFGADGVWYFVSDNGGTYVDQGNATAASPIGIDGDYVEFTGLGSLPNTGWTNIAFVEKGSFATQFKTNVFPCYASTVVPPYDSGWVEGGPGLPASGPPSLGFNPNAWSDVEIKQMNGVVSLFIDKTRIFAYTNIDVHTSLSTNGMLMLGYEDPHDGNETPDTAVYYSNLRVVQLTAPAIASASFDNVNNKLVFNFTSNDGDLTASSFTVVGATTVNGTYSAVSGATVTQVSSNGAEVFQASVPITASKPMEFCRIVQK